ncbi:hypothetical protein ABPG72_011599 [Tetrahymena utriculariae]
MQVAEPVSIGLAVGRICAIVIPSAVQSLRLIFSAIFIGIQAQNAVQNQKENNFQYFRYIIEDNQINQNPLDLYLNGTRIIFESTLILNKLLVNQQILKIQRCAMSLWKYFPSGVASFFSMLFMNQCVRHEYLIIYTQKYVISAEISRSKNCQTCQFQNQSLEPNFQPQNCNCNNKKGFCFQIMIWDAQNLDEQNSIYQRYNKRAFSRVLKCFSVEKNNIAEQFSFSKLLSLWKLIFNIYQARVKDNLLNKIYRLLVRNCKTFARSSLYFLDKDFQKSKIFESIFGLYSDKPGYLFDPIQSGVLCVAEKSLELLKNDYNEGKNRLQQIMEDLRQLNI